MKTSSLIATAALAAAANLLTLCSALGSSDQSPELQLAQFGRYRSNVAASPSNSEGQPFEDLDRAPTPELKLGAILKRNWVVNNPANCAINLMNHASMSECIEKKGFSLTVKSPADCQLTVTEEHPAPASLKQRWDGSTEGSYLKVREISFDLGTLREDTISVQPAVELKFQVTKQKVPVVRVVWSDHPDQWITLQPPPSEEDFTEALPDPQLRKEAFGLAASQWSQKILPFSRFQIDKGMIQLSPQSLTVSTSPVGLLWASPVNGNAVAQEAQKRLVGVLKDILSKCRD